MEKFQLAIDILESGNYIPIPAVHAIFPDIEKDDTPFRFSKTADSLIDDMQSSGICKIADGIIEIDASTMGFFSSLDGFEKKASSSSDILKKLNTFYRGVIEKLGALQPPDYDQVAEHDLWNKWKQTGDKRHLSALLTRYEPLINKHVKMYEGAPVAPLAIKGEAKRVALMAFHNYNPKRGVKLNTFVTSYMPKVGRYVNELQNVGYVPEEKRLKIGRFNEAVDELHSKHGRQPTTDELADHLKWSTKDIGNMRTVLRKNLIAENNEDSLGRMETPRDERMKVFVGYIAHELKGNEKNVFEHIHGLNGRPKLDNDQKIAKHLGMNHMEVYRTRQKIADTVKKFEKFI